MSEDSVVLFSVPEFAFLVHRTEEIIRKALRDGKIKGVQRMRHGEWHIPDSELRKYWGALYGSGDENGKRKHHAKKNRRI